MLKRTLVAGILLGAGWNLTFAEGLDAAIQAKVDGQIKQAQAWAVDPVIVNAVKAYNSAPPADSQAMTQDKWKALGILDPFVRSFSKNPADGKACCPHTKDTARAGGRTPLPGFGFYGADDARPGFEPPVR